MMRRNLDQSESRAQYIAETKPLFVPSLNLKKGRELKRYYLGDKYPGVYFTQQEAKCMVYFLQGFKNKMVGAAMRLTDRTVGFYCCRMRGKIPSKTKAELIAHVKETNFIDFVQELRS